MSGTLSPRNGRHKLTIEYLPPESSGAFLPAVQRTVTTDSAGRFGDRYTLDSAGKWIVLVSWAGDATHEPAGGPPCTGVVRRAQRQLSITCPQSASIGTPGTFSGTLSGASADVVMAVLYEDPSGAVLAHTVTTDSLGNFRDSFAPSQTGRWQAIVHYNGDANVAPAQAACRFTVPAPVPNDFSISVSPSSGSVQQGASASTTVTTSVISGSAEPWSYAVTGAPNSYSLTSGSPALPGAFTLRFDTSAATSPGNYPITITGMDASSTHSTTYTLTVLAPSSLSLNCTPDPNRTYIKCTGRLTSAGAGIPSDHISLSYQPPPGSGSPTTDNVMTAADGSFSDQLNAPVGGLLGTGGWQVQAQYGGDSTHAPASNTESVTVL